MDTLCPSSPLKILTGADVRVSTPIRFASLDRKIGIFCRNTQSPSLNAVTAKGGKSLARETALTPGRKVVSPTSGLVFPFIKEKMPSAGAK
jgi:hypothetical protein